MEQQKQWGIRYPIDLLPVSWDGGDDFHQTV